MKLALLLVLPLAAVSFRQEPGASSTPRASPQAAPPRSPADAVRAELTAVYDEWEKARTSYDKAAFERMLAPDFWVQIGAQKFDRARFLEMISAPQGGARLARFDAAILTLTHEKDAWYAVITEKLETEFTRPDGTKARAYSLWVTKDGFRKDDERWAILSSEALGAENWTTQPPFPDWSS